LYPGNNFNDCPENQLTKFSATAELLLFVNDCVKIHPNISFSGQKNIFQGRGPLLLLLLLMHGAFMALLVEEVHPDSNATVISTTLSGGP